MNPYYSYQSTTMPQGYQQPFFHTFNPISMQHMYMQPSTFMHATCVQPMAVPSMGMQPFTPSIAIQPITSSIAVQPTTPSIAVQPMTVPNINAAAFNVQSIEQQLKVQSAAQPIPPSSVPTHPDGNTNIRRKHPQHPQIHKRRFNRKSTHVPTPMTKEESPLEIDVGTRKRKHWNERRKPWKKNDEKNGQTTTKNELTIERQRNNRRRYKPSAEMKRLKNRMSKLQAKIDEQQNDEAAKNNDKPTPINSKEPYKTQSTSRQRCHSV